MYRVFSTRSLIGGILKLKPLPILYCGDGHTANYGQWVLGRAPAYRTYLAMSSWDPPEEKEKEFSHGPGAKGKEVLEERDFSETVYNLRWVDYVIFAVLASIPAGFLTMLLLWEFFPAFQDTAGVLVERLLDILPQLVGGF